MRWRKLGHLWAPDGSREWMLTHAANPVVESIEGDLARIYFAGRDARQRSHIGSVEIELRPPFWVARSSVEPVLAPGAVGAFDDSGVVPACVVQVGQRTLLYYLGWNLGVTVPWRNSIGLAIREPGAERFERVSPAPVLDRNRHDPFSISYPWVMPRPGGGWRMWYGSNLRWGARQEDMAHVIKYAESDDAVSWQPTGRIAIDLADPSEYAIARPCVVVDGGLHRMWYSHRGPQYRIGYAESPDGVNWTRCDAQAGIAPADSGWDSISIQYAFVFDHAGRRLMLYNGQAYGRTGFGLAELEA
jgi:hypothetical protein